MTENLRWNGSKRRIPVSHHLDMILKFRVCSLVTGTINANNLNGQEVMS